MKDAEVSFTCECGQTLGAVFYEDDTNDQTICLCGRSYNVSRPSIHLAEGEGTARAVAPIEKI